MKKLIGISILFYSIYFECFSQEYIKGYYINLQNDTISCEIETYSKRKLQKQDYNYIRVKTDSVTEKIILPNEIYEYYKGSDRFKSFYSSEDNMYFFAKLITEGNVFLWEKKETSDISPHMYILKKKADTNFVVMKIIGNQVKVTEGIITTIKITQNELFWNAILYLYFKDCEDVATKIINGYYSSADIISIVKAYNSCNTTNTH